MGYVYVPDNQMNGLNAGSQTIPDRISRLTKAQYQQNGLQQPSQQDIFNVRSVGSREEAVATPVDYFKPTVILGLNHGMIYFKKFNAETGETIFWPFKYAPDMAADPQYVTMEMFNELKNIVMNSMAKPARGKKSAQEASENE